MAKIGRNAPCPCGSGKKYKNCCKTKDTQLLQDDLPSDRFSYKSGSYGGPGGYMPSILSYKENGSSDWIEHLCLVKPDEVFDDEESASELAERHLEKAQKIVDSGGSTQEFALSLRHEGYKSVSDFNIIK